MCDEQSRVRWKILISYKVIVICRNNYIQKSKNKYANNVQ